MITILSIFGIILLGSTLPGVAKNKLPGNAPGTCVQPAGGKPTSDILLEGVSGVASVVYALGVSSGSFIVGGLYEFMVYNT